MLFLRGPGVEWVYRANPPVEDRTRPSFNKDGDWHDMSFTDVIPVGTKLFLCYSKVKANEDNGAMVFRRKGETSIINVVTAVAEHAGLGSIDNLWMIPNSSGIVEYKADTVEWSIINLTIRGWFV